MQSLCKNFICFETQLKNYECKFHYFRAIMTILYMQSGLCILLHCLVYKLFYIDLMKVIVFSILT